MLKPIIKRFISAFDGVIDEDFRGRIASPKFHGSGTHTLGGWITAFCIFTEKGEFNGDAHEKYTWDSEREARYVLEGATYPIINEDDIPTVSSGDVKIIDTFGREFPAMHIAGNMGMVVTRGTIAEGDIV